MAGVSEGDLRSPCMKFAPLLPPPAARSAATPHATIILLYESYATAVRGKVFCEQLAGQLDVRCNLNESLWRSDLLAVPEFRHEAARAALAADFVVLAMHGDKGLTKDLDRWCEEWMSRASGRDITFVVLFDPTTAQRLPMRSIRSRLRKVASANGIHFFAHACACSEGDGRATADLDEEPPSAETLPQAAADRGATILVVDDYSSICDMIGRSLTAAGHRTLAAHDGAEAQQVIEANGHSIGLVLTDIEMPRFRGDDLACWILREHPGIRILLMSSIRPSRVETLGLPLLEKPFSLDSLVSTVSTLLHQAPR